MLDESSILALSALYRLTWFILLVKLYTATLKAGTITNWGKLVVQVMSTASWNVVGYCCHICSAKLEQVPKSLDRFANSL